MCVGIALVAWKIISKLQAILKPRPTRVYQRMPQHTSLRLIRLYQEIFDGTDQGTLVDINSAVNSLPSAYHGEEPCQNGVNVDWDAQRRPRTVRFLCLL